MRTSPALFALAFALGCGLDAKPTPPSSTPAVPAPVPSRAISTEAAGIRFLERTTGGGSEGDKLPLIVAIHGLGDRPESFVHLFDGFAGRVRLIVPYGEPYGDGFSWFPIGARADPEAFSAGIARAADRLSAMISALVEGRPTVGKPIVTGFSQGGMLSFALSVLHPELVGEAYPVSGVLPAPLWPPAWPVGKTSPPIRAFHGDADSRVSFADDQRGVERLRELGLVVELRAYAGVGHTVSAEMRRDLHTALGEAATRAGR